MCLASYALIVLALVFGNADRFWKHDEAVYLSQALPDENLAWGPQRAIGILPLAYVVAPFVDNPLLGRFVAGFLAAAAMALALTIWSETISLRTTVVAAVLGHRSAPTNALVTKAGIEMIEKWADGNLEGND